MGAAHSTAVAWTGGTLLRGTPRASSCCATSATTRSTSAFGRSPARSTAHVASRSPRPSSSTAACSTPTTERVGCVAVVLERVPERRTLVAERGGALAQRGVDTAYELEDVVDSLRLRLRVPNERRAQAPVVGARPFGEVDETRQLGRFDLDRHRPKPISAGHGRSARPPTCGRVVAAHPARCQGLATTGFPDRGAPAGARQGGSKMTASNSTTARPAPSPVEVAQAAAPMLSSEQLIELLASIRGADTVELKATVPDTDRRSVVAAFRHGPVGRADPPSRVLRHARSRVESSRGRRASRRVQAKPGDTVVKLRPVLPDTLSPTLRASPSSASKSRDARRLRVLRIHEGRCRGCRGQGRHRRKAADSEALEQRAAVVLQRPRARGRRPRSTRDARAHQRVEAQVPRRPTSIGASSPNCGSTRTGRVCSSCRRRRRRRRHSRSPRQPRTFSPRRASICRPSSRRRRRRRSSSSRPSAQLRSPKRNRTRERMTWWYVPADCNHVIRAMPVAILVGAIRRARPSLADLLV